MKGGVRGVTSDRIGGQVGLVGLVKSVQEAAFTRGCDSAVMAFHVSLSWLRIRVIIRVKSNMRDPP